MGWASRHIEQLQQGQTVSFRPHGASMEPRVKSGALCVVAPIALATVCVGDIVLCRVNGREYLHLVKAVGQDGRVQIGNNHGRVNGWTRAVFGRLLRTAL